MRKPSIEEVAAYCQERGNGIDAGKFVDHYEMVGWVYGKHRQPVKDWKACVRLWERKDRERMRGGSTAAIVAKLTDVSWADDILNDQRRLT